MSDPRITVYTTEFCGYCHAAKALLQRSGVPFIEEDLSNDPEKLMALKERTGHSTVPMILLDDALIGGYMELQSRISSDGAESLMPTE